MIVDGLATHQRQTLTDEDFPDWERVIADKPAADVREVWQTLLVTSTDYLRPAHLHQGLRALRVRRLTDAGDPPPAAVDPDDIDAYQGWVRCWRKAIGDGADADEALRLADDWARAHDCFESRLRGEPVQLPPGFATMLHAAITRD